MARKEIEYTVIIGKEGSPSPAWSRPNVAGILVAIAQRVLEKKQAAGEEAPSNPAGLEKKLGEENFS